MSDWPNPGDALVPRRTRGMPSVAWEAPRIASRVVDIPQGELLIVIARALNPGNDCSEEGYDQHTRRKWQRTWWMAMRPCLKLVWINEAQIESLYEKVRT